MNLDKINQAVCELCQNTGSFISNQGKSFSFDKVEKKGFNDFVSYVDKQAEARLVDGLKKIFPEAGFITEENTVYDDSGEYTWIIDPLDGTTNFIHGVPPFAISIALVKDKKPVAGVIYEINQNEMFYANINGPAYLNGKQIKVSGITDLQDALISTGFPYYDFERLDPYIESMKYLMNNSAGIRRHGSAATDLAYVAAGRFEAFYEYGLKPWDVAAGIIIVQQAGGIISDFKGENNYLFGREIIAANNSVFSVFLNKIGAIMN